jgi:hypothetical protein
MDLPENFFPLIETKLSSTSSHPIFAGSFFLRFGYVRVGYVGFGRVRLGLVGLGWVRLG